MGRGAPGTRSARPAGMPGEGPRDMVDEASEESFPCSDPPAFTTTHPGPPCPAEPEPLSEIAKPS